MKTTGKELSARFQQLEADVKDALKDAIRTSKLRSRTHNDKCIKVNVFDYVSLILLNNKLTFLDKDGYEYGLYADCAIEDLIDIIEHL